MKVENAEGKMELKETISRSAKQGALLQSLTCRLAAAEQEVDSARVEAVEAFKDSQAFADAVAECSIDSTSWVSSIARRRRPSSSLT